MKGAVLFLLIIILSSFVIAGNSSKLILLADLEDMPYINDSNNIFLEKLESHNVWFEATVFLLFVLAVVFVWEICHKKLVSRLLKK